MTDTKYIVSEDLVPRLQKFINELGDAYTGKILITMSQTYMDALVANHNEIYGKIEKDPITGKEEPVGVPFPDDLDGGTLYGHYVSIDRTEGAPDLVFIHDSDAKLDKRNILKFDPYVSRVYTVDDWINECYTGLPNISMLKEQWDKLPHFQPDRHIIKPMPPSELVKKTTPEEIATYLITVATEFRSGCMNLEIFKLCVATAHGVLQEIT